VSLKTISVCILRDDGSPVFEGKVATEPAALTLTHYPTPVPNLTRRTWAPMFRAANQPPIEA
jgi:hypothetical protein